MRKKPPTSLVIVFLLSWLTGCAAPEPVLRPTKRLLFYGREQAQEDIATCRRQVEHEGLRPGTYQGANAATGAVLGVTLGGAMGASAGVIGGLAGVAIGAASGAGLGLAVGLAGGAYKPLVPDHPYADAMTHCLEEKGHEVGGWQ